MTNEEMAFSRWKATVDSVMKKIYGIDTNDAGIEDERLSDHWSTGEAPEHFVEWFGENTISYRNARWGSRIGGKSNSALKSLLTMVF